MIIKSSLTRVPLPLLIMLLLLCRCANSSIPLSEKEYQMIANLKKSCNCNVVFNHNDNLIKGIQPIDSSVGISLFWSQKPGTINPYDITNKGRDRMITYGGFVAKMLLANSSYKKYYKKVRVRFSDCDKISSDLGDTETQVRDTTIVFRIQENNNLVLE